MLYEVVLRLVFTEFLVQLTRGTHVAIRVSQLLSVRELWTSVEIQRQVHLFSEGIAHSPAAHQCSMFSTPEIFLG